MFVLLSSLAVVAGQPQQAPPTPGFCYDTKCRGAFCLQGERGEATYCLGPKGIPSAKEEENCSFCCIQLKYAGTDRDPDGHPCWKYAEVGVPFPLEWCFDQSPEKEPQD